MKWLKKHRLNIIISLLVVIFTLVCFYMLEVHVPYTSRDNELESIKNEICEKDNYTYISDFTEYNSDQTYYILKVKEKKTKKYVVYNEKLKFTYEYKGEIIPQQTCKEEFKNKYKQECTSISFGYENSTLVYSLKFHEEDTLIYAFYSVDTGKFIKAYKL